MCKNDRKCLAYHISLLKNAVKNSSIPYRSRMRVRLEWSANGSPGSMTFSVVFRWTQPERDMRWLYGLLDHCYQVLAQLVQIHLLAQGGAEICHGLSSVILAAIETTINDGLDAMAQGLEEHPNGER